MKYPYIFLFLLFCGFKLVDQPELHRSNTSFFKKNNYVSLKDDYLFIAATEVSNAEYRAYVEWALRHRGMESYLKALPDTMVWKNSLHMFAKPYVEYYFRHPAYDRYPVVGITWQQAQDYCRWAAGRMMESKDFKALAIDSIVMRLPSEKEWMEAARGTLSESAIWPWPGNTIRMEGGQKRDQGKTRLNVRTDNYSTVIPAEYSDFGFITTQVDSYWPNTLGLYNICGNVSEWVEEKKAKGGGWNDFPIHARIDYNAPVMDDTVRSSVIGFRPVIEVVKYKTSIRAKPFRVNAVMLDKSVVKVNDSLYAAIFEADNLLYNTFLAEHPEPQYRVNDKAWEMYTRYRHMQQYSSLPQFDLYPVVNIEYESAVKFCEWLTEKYNNSDKKRYKKVVFRLPTETEWIWAAMGGNQNAPYPWGGPFTRNSRGAYLANFSPLEEQYLARNDNQIQRYEYPGNDSTISRGVDGLVFTGPVKSYFPNAIGLYNCSGNVAEMTSKKWLSKGGSWTSSQSGILLSSDEKYKWADCNLGFRYVMEIVER